MTIEKKKKTIIYLDLELREMLKESCKEKNTTFNQEILWILRFYFKNFYNENL